MVKTLGKYSTTCIYLVLALATLTVYFQVHSFDFVNYDDYKYVAKNQNVTTGLTRENIIWAFTKSHVGNWHPLTWLSHMLDCELFGTNPGWHHLTNLLLHIINTLLLFAVFKRMTGAIWQSAFVAATFALHPLHVESVAWISERKDVLSTLFWLLTMAAYLRYTKSHSISWYLVTFVVFAMGLTAKQMLVTLPFVLLLLDYWPLGRFQNNRTGLVNSRSQLQTLYHLVREKVPFFALSVISSIVIFIVQQRGAAVKGADEFPLIIRIANIPVAYTRYIGKMIWPTRLAMFYPHPADTLPLWQPLLTALLLLSVSTWVIRLATKHKYLLTGWFWFLGTLVPVIGLIQVGEQAIADRYTYVPLIGLFIVIGWGISDLLTKWRYRKTILVVSSVAVLLALSICAWLQVGRWRNSITLFEHTLKVTKDNYIVHLCLADTLLKYGKIDRVVNHISEALRIRPDYRPDYLKALNDKGYDLLVQGRSDSAVIYFVIVLRISPDNDQAYNNLGLARESQGKLDEAVKSYQEALRLKPDFAEAHYNLASVLLQQGKLNQAVIHFTEALRIKPDFTEARDNLNDILNRQKTK